MTRQSIRFYIETMAPSGAGSFDPAGYFAFDLSRGEVRTRTGDRVVVVASDVLAPLVAMAVAQGDLTAVRSLGKRMGEQAARSLGGNAHEHSPEQVLNHASAVLSVLGWGRLGLERWGRALVVQVEGAPNLDGDKLGLAALLGGLITSLSKRDAACVPVGEGAAFLVVDPAVAEQVWSWSKSGASVPTIVARLAPGGGA